MSTIIGLVSTFRLPLQPFFIRDIQITPLGLFIKRGDIICINFHITYYVFTFLDKFINLFRGMITFATAGDTCIKPYHIIITSKMCVRSFARTILTNKLTYQ